VSTALVPLAALMGLVTYATRAIPLLAPGLDRLPAVARLYTRLVAPAILAALAASSTVVRTDASGRPFLHVGAEWIAVGLCIAFVAWRRNLLVGLVLAAGLMAALRALGIAG
jgi:branched-subunit amino acid transport protein